VLDGDPTVWRIHSDMPGSGAVTSGATDRPDLAASFQHPGVARAYAHRPPYPPEVFDVLTGLISEQPSTVLDLGAGEGALARPLAGLVDRVDAVDISAAMVAAGRCRPGGDQANLNWIVGAAESVPLGGPYALVAAGASLHWMSLPDLLPRVRNAMTDGAYFTVVEHDVCDEPWRLGLLQVIRRHSRHQAYNADFSVVNELAATGLWTETGRMRTTAVPFRQRIGDYVEALHSTSSLARELMPPEEAAAFGAAITDLVEPYANDGVLELAIVADLAWGRIGSQKAT
jgi:SAM-dependent methyltransferase